MKSIVMPIHEAIVNEQLSEETKKQLETELTEIKETLATPNGVDTRSKFTAVDMWNVHRQGRSASDMIRRWNLN